MGMSEQMHRILESKWHECVRLWTINLLTKMCVYAAIIGLSLLTSCFLLPWSVPNPGEATDAIIRVVLFIHCVAFVVGVFIPRISAASCVIVFAFAFSLTGVSAINKVRLERYIRYSAVYDRFRENVACPIPESVSNLSFQMHVDVPGNLSLKFDIAKSDLDAIIRNLKLRLLAPDDLSNRDDLFRNSSYLPLEGQYELFQGIDEHEDILTLKSNEQHTQAVFRREFKPRCYNK